MFKVLAVGWFTFLCMAASFCAFISLGTIPPAYIVDVKVLNFWCLGVLIVMCFEEIKKIKDL